MSTDDPHASQELGSDMPWDGHKTHHGIGPDRLGFDRYPNPFVSLPSPSLVKCFSFSFFSFSSRPFRPSATIGAAQYTLFLHFAPQQQPTVAEIATDELFSLSFIPFLSLSLSSSFSLLLLVVSFRWRSDA